MSKQYIFRRQQELVKDSDLFDPNKLMRMPICLCIDTSSEMESNSRRLREDISALVNDICNDEFLNSCVELGIYTFSAGSQKVRGISILNEVESATLTLSFDKGCQQPNIASCLKECVEDIERRMRDYNVKMVNYYQPHIIVIGASEPYVGDDWEAIVELVQNKQARGKLSVIPIVIGNEAMDTYKQLSMGNIVYRGNISDLKDILKTVKNSMRKLSESSSSIYDKLNSMVSDWDMYLEMK